MNTFKDNLTKKKFIFTAEITPPKGTDLKEFTETAKILKNYVTAVNITDNPRSVMKLGSLSACKILIDNGIEPIFQITCRDRNRIAVQSDMLSAWVLGIRNMLITTGDNVLAGDHKSAKPVFDVDSTQMLYIAKQLNLGFDLEKNNLHGKTNFCYGAALNPFLNPIELNLIRIRQKNEQGTSFYQTQPIFDIESFKSFYSQFKGTGITTPVLGGLLLLKSVRMAQFINTNVPGINVPEHIISEMEKSSDPNEFAISLAVETGKKLKKYVQGLHIMTIGQENKFERIIKEINAE